MASLWMAPHLARRRAAGLAENLEHERAGARARARELHHGFGVRSGRVLVVRHGRPRNVLGSPGAVRPLEAYALFFLV